MAGKLHSYTAYLDYTPSVFPSVYRRSCGMSDASRFNVQSVMGLVKNKYLIQKGPLPICLVKHKGDTTVAN